MAQLTYWAFEAYAHVPEVAAAKAALAHQFQATFLEQWRLNRHVCENFSPKKGATECTGDKVRGSRDADLCVLGAAHSAPPPPASLLPQFYSWGALGGLLSILERGVY
jgi:hypothetical protein